MEANSEWFWTFCVSLSVVCIAVHVLLMRSDYVGYVLNRRDLAAEALRKYKEEDTEVDGAYKSLSVSSSSSLSSYRSDADLSRSEPILTRIEVVKLLYPSIVSIFLSILATVTTTTLFAFVPSSNGWTFLAVLLTYVKNFSDFGGRVLTLIPYSIKSGKVILAGGMLRGILLPAFLIYTFVGLFRSDLFIVLFILFASVLSGYLNTSCYQWAAATAPSNSKAIAAQTMNISFQLAIYMSFALQFVIALLSMNSSSEETSTGNC